MTLTAVLFVTCKSVSKEAANNEMMMLQTKRLDEKPEPTKTEDVLRDTVPPSQPSKPATLIYNSVSMKMFDAENRT